MSATAKPSSRPVAASVELNIDELVLHGFGRVDAGRFERALRGELGRLLAAAEAPDGLMALGDRAQLELGALQVGKGASAEQLGVGVAQALVRGLGQSASQRGAQTGRASVGNRPAGGEPK